MSSMKMLRKILIYWLPPILWAVIIYKISSVPNLKSGLVDAIDLILRKLAHFAEYGLLSILVYRAFSLNRPNRKSIILIAWIVASLYAITDEWHQTFVIGRQGSAVDVMIDSAGALFGVLIWYLFWQHKKIKNQKT
ncbi:VanZ family protein [Patescibacteria group bacterium]